MNTHWDNDEGPIILTYKDTTLYQKDLDILYSNKTWLNDRLIGFYYDYLDTIKSENVIFVNPSTMMLLAYFNDVEELCMFLSPLGLDAYEVVVIPVNDSEGSTAGGSHWSLLVYRKSVDQFYAFDSYYTEVNSNAMRAARKLKVILRSRSEGIKVIDTPKQRNGSSCGLFVLAISELFIDKGFIEAVDCLGCVPERVSVMRSVMADMIEDMRKERDQ
eukprot:TRINITY_DN9360_c0_g1_i1.p1 TRINITY_DN9360_c0_g1~~TRINITY_DN9360_c0_g1_i1.p1  ORF type:complete len:217 (+),score=42.34 TRINITY_DN9360_c0_g1_i1:38-688(+)